MYFDARVVFVMKFTTKVRRAMRTLIRLFTSMNSYNISRSCLLLAIKLGKVNPPFEPRTNREA